MPPTPLPMTPMKALELLDKAVSTIPSNRETHMALIQAREVLAAFIAANPPKPAASPEQA